MSTTSGKRGQAPFPAATRRPRGAGERRQLQLMLAPYAIGALLLFGGPAAFTLLLSLFRADLLGPPEWIGLGNFSTLLDDPVFVEALWRSALFVAITVPLRLVVATAIALLLHRRFRGVGAARTAVYVPTVMPEIAWALVWLFIVNPVYGPLNAVLGLVGAGQPSWLTEPSAAFAVIAAMSVFTVGEAFIVALAARQEIPAELDEVARLEGASPWYQLRTVTLPLMAPVLALLAVRDVAIALQASFVPGYVLTDGGPDRATTLLPLYIYDKGFEQLEYGYAAAMTFVLFALTALVALVAARLMRRWRFGLGD